MAPRAVAGTDVTNVTELQVWTMDGLTVAAAGTLAYLSNDWQTVSPGHAASAASRRRAADAAWRDTGLARTKSPLVG